MGCRSAPLFRACRSCSPEPTDSWQALHEPGRCNKPLAVPALCAEVVSAQVPRQAPVFMEQSAFASLFLLGGTGSQSLHADGKEQGDIPENLSPVLVNGRESVLHPAPLALCTCTLSLKAQSWDLVVSCGGAVSEAADVLFAPGLQPAARALPSESQVQGHPQEVGGLHGGAGGGGLACCPHHQT